MVWVVPLIEDRVVTPRCLFRLASHFGDGRLSPWHLLHIRSFS